MIPPNVKTLDKLEFNNHTREEVILWLQENAKKNPSFERLANWIAESSEFDKSHYAVQMALADARRSADQKASKTPHPLACSYCGRRRVLKPGTTHMLSPHCQECCSRLGSGVKCEDEE